MEPNEEQTTATSLGALLDAGDGAMVTLVAGDTHLMAHSAVLAARSPAFVTKYRHDTQEDSSSQLTITDMEGPVLRQLLAFFYTLKAPNMPDMAPQLLAAADNCGLSGLKDRYEQQLISQLSIPTAATTAILAVSHSCNSLRQAALKFIKANTIEVMATQAWADAVRNQPDAFVEVCQLLSELPPEPSSSHVSESSKLEVVEDDLGALLDAGDSAVVTLEAGDTRLVAHTAVVAARSPALAAKFHHDTQEAGGCQLAMPDVEGPVLRQLVAYLYTLQVPQLPSMVPQLLAAADVYGLSALKAECEHQLAAQLSVETAAATAVLALRHSCNGLRQAAINFMRAHTLDVMATQGWAQAVRTQAKDVVELSRLLSEPSTETSEPPPAASGTTHATQPQSDLSERDQTPAAAELPTVAPTSDIAVPAASSKIDPEDKVGMNLLRAASLGEVEKLQALLEAGADLGAKQSGLLSTEWTALHCAANRGHEEAVSQLLAAGAEVEARDAIQRTPLHWAAVRGHTAVVRQLVAASADPNARDDCGLTPLHLAAWNGHADTATALMDLGADLTARTNEGNTPMDIAKLYDKEYMLDVLIRRS